MRRELWLVTDSKKPESAARAVGRPARGSVARVFLLAFVAYAYFMPRWADWNIDSRFDLTRAIVDGHTLSIDKYNANTWDKAVYGGHYYSDKAPGTAMLGTVVYGAYRLSRQVAPINALWSGIEGNSVWNLAIRLGQSSTQAAPAAKGSNLGGCQRSGVAGNVQYIPWGNRLYPPFREWALSKYVVTIGVDALVSAAFVAFLFWFLAQFAIGGLARWCTTLVYAFASVALPYSTVFYSHEIAAASLFAAFALVYLWTRQRTGTRGVLVAGFLLGFAFFTEYTVAILIAFVGLYALWRMRRSGRALSVFCVAAVVPVAGVLAYNAAIFAGPLDTGYTHDFCWSSAQAAGFAGFTYPRWGPLFDLTVGPFRGLFYMTPFLLLALPGAYLMWKRGYRLEPAVCLSAAAVFILAISAYWGWNGGKVDGPRYLVPAVPFLAFPAAFAVDALARHWAGRVVAVALALLSAAVTWALFLGGELFPISWLRSPLTEYSLPQLAGNHIAPNAGMFFGLRGWQSLAPLALLLVAWCAWQLTVTRRRSTADRPATG